MTHEEGLLYRLAYGRAYELFEARRYSCQTGRNRTNPAAGDGAERIAAETCRQLRVVDPGEVALVMEATDDALEGRRPRW
jgi:hypothetical protein